MYMKVDGTELEEGVAKWLPGGPDDWKKMSPDGLSLVLFSLSTCHLYVISVLDFLSLHCFISRSRHVSKAFFQKFVSEWLPS